MLVPLTGTGLASGSSASLSFGESSVAFGPQTVGTTSAQSLLYITNNGSVPVVIQSYAASLSDYTITAGNCGPAPFQMNPQTYCYVGITFSPTVAGTRTANLVLTDTATGSPQSIPLTGTGLASATGLEFYPAASISFPDQPVGQPTAQQTIYLEIPARRPLPFTAL